MTEKTAVIQNDMPDADYFAYPAFSQSQAKTLLKSPALFAHERTHPRENKKAFDLGHVFHELVLHKGAGIEVVLDPAKVEARLRDFIRTAETVDGEEKPRTKAAVDREVKAEAAYALAVIRAEGVHVNAAGVATVTADAHADSYLPGGARTERDRIYAEGKTPVLAHELADARAMADATLAHPAAGDLFAEGDAEVSIFWTDPATGVDVKARIDWLRQVDGRWTIVDLKSARDASPRGFAKHAGEYGYHVQAWHYREAVRLALGVTDVDYLWAVTENAAPHQVAVYRASEEDIEAGGRLMRRALEMYRDCTDANVWPSAYPDSITPLVLPEWVTRTWTASEDMDASETIAALEELIGENE